MVERDGSISKVIVNFQHKLGRCKHCMSQSVLLFLSAWGLVVLLARMDPTSVALLALGTMLAVMTSSLLIAHGVFYTLRQLKVIADQDGTELPTAADVTASAGRPASTNGIPRRSCCGG